MTDDKTTIDMRRIDYCGWVIKDSRTGKIYNPQYCNGTKIYKTRGFADKRIRDDRLNPGIYSAVRIRVTEIS